MISQDIIKRLINIFMAFNVMRYQFFSGESCIWVSRYLNNSSVAVTYLQTHNCNLFFKLQMLIHLKSRLLIYVLNYGSLFLTLDT